MDFDKLAAPLVQVYEEITDQILENIARHFNTGKGLPTIDWQMRKLAEMGQLRQENIRIIARKTKQNPELIRIALENAAGQALKHAEPELKEAVRRGYLHDGGPLEASKGVERVFTSYQQQAEDTANLVNTVMLDSGMQSYRRVVSDVVQYEQAAMAVTQADAAQNILNAETGKVLTGVSSRQEALRRAIKRMADNGLTGFVDRGGHNWQPETYINMDIRSTCGNVATEAVFARNEDYGNDLFWVTVKATARPLCYPWQGKVISRNDRSGYVEDLDGNRVEIIPISSTSYGEPAGLYGINCGHVPPNVFIPGLGKVRGEVPDEAENNARYAESQEQRGLERRIRYAKREAAALEAAGLDTADAREKVKAAQADMRAFINRTGRTRRSDREQIVVSTLAKAEKHVKSPITAVADVLGVEEKNIAIAGLPEKSQKSISEQVQKAIDYFPQLKGHLRKISYNGDITAVAESKSLTGEIQVSKSFLDYEKMSKSYAYDAKIGFFAKGTTADSIIVHEIGHQIDGLLTKNKLFGGEITQYGTIRSSQAIQKEILAKLGLSDQRLREIRQEWRDRGYTGRELTDAVLWERKEFISSHVSEYAATNEREFFAECFSELVTSKHPREAALALGEILERAKEALK